MDVLRSVAKWISAWPQFFKLFVTSVGSSIMTFGSMGLKVWFGDFVKDHSYGDIIFWSAIVILYLSIFAAVYGGLKYLISADQKRKVAQKKTLTEARVSIDEIVSKNIEILDIGERSAWKLYVRHSPIEIIKMYIESIFISISKVYTDQTDIDDVIKFEATFMAKSPIDHGISIYAWANTDRRSPKSLLKRPGNPLCYDGTVTADLYRDQNPMMKIIEDTSNTKYGYTELYRKQLERIKSSIVYPVISGQQKLQGTVVIHCDSKNFFLESDRKFWEAFMAIFGKRISLELGRLNDAIEPHIGDDCGGECKNIQSQDLILQ